MPEVRQKKKKKKKKNRLMSRLTAPLHAKDTQFTAVILENQLKFTDSLTKLCSLVSERASDDGGDDDNRAKVVETRVALI